MKDPSKKRYVVREVTTSGKIFLHPDTIKAIKDNKIDEGNPLAHAEAAAILAAKQTSALIPHCHQIPIDSVSVAFDLQDKFIEAKTVVKALSRTGVEMESLMATTVALNTILEMVKHMEEDGDGQYPDLWITDIRVEKKTKKAPPAEKKFSAV